MQSKFVLATAWLFLAVIFAFKFQMDYFYSGHETHWLACFALSSIQWSAWACVSGLIAKYSGAIVLANRVGIKPIVLYLIFGLFVSFALFLLMRLVAEIFVKSGWIPNILSGQSSILLNLAIYVAIVAVVFGLAFFKRNLQLRSELTESQLQSLRMQLRPHFLFNVLNTITMLIETEPAKAAQVTSLLGELLRTNLVNNVETRVPLSREIELIEKYLQIEKIRFEDRINIVYDIDPMSLEHLVPAMLLQPIVENAMCHGFGKSVNTGELTIRTRCESNLLWIEIVDSGNGTPIGDFKERIGLGNTRSRLEKMYGQDFLFQIKSLSGGSTCVRIEVPTNARSQGVSHATT